MTADVHDFNKLAEAVQDHRSNLKALQRDRFELANRITAAEKVLREAEEAFAAAADKVVKR